MLGCGMRTAGMSGCADIRCAAPPVRYLQNPLRGGCRASNTWRRRFLFDRLGKGFLLFFRGREQKNYDLLLELKNKRYFCVIEITVIRVTEVFHPHCEVRERNS